MYIYIYCIYNIRKWPRILGPKCGVRRRSSKKKTKSFDRPAECKPRPKTCCNSCTVQCIVFSLGNFGRNFKRECLRGRQEIKAFQAPRTWRKKISDDFWQAPASLLESSSRSAGSQYGFLLVSFGFANCSNLPWVCIWHLASFGSLRHLICVMLARNFSRFSGSPALRFTTALLGLIHWFDTLV